MVSVEPDVEPQIILVIYLDIHLGLRQLGISGDD